LSHMERGSKRIGWVLIRATSSRERNIKKGVICGYVGAS
jgi:hypothetical protein